MKILELFGGITASTKALMNGNFFTNIESEVIEYDEKVVKAYNKLWEKDIVPRDVIDFKGEKNKYDLLIAGFPCQPFSIAGNQKGFNDPRGKLYLETIRITKETLPKYVVYENVKNIMSPKNKWIIDEMVDELKKLGYKVRVQILNGKDFTNQWRERVFVMASRVNSVREIYKRELKHKDISSYLTWNRQGILDTKNIITKPYDKEYFNDTKKKYKVKGLFCNYDQENIITGENFPYIGTITAQGANSGQKVLIDYKTSEFVSKKIIMKLSPVENMRLMGWEDKWINRLDGLPKYLINYVAGNSMIIPVMEAVLNNLLWMEDSDF